MIVYASFMALLMAAALYDLAALRIPNAVCAGLAALFLVPAAMHPAAVAIPHHVLAGLLVFLAGWGLHGLGFLGGGDVKLLAATALWAGLDLLVLHLACMALFGLALLLVLVPLRHLWKLCATDRPAGRPAGRPLSLAMDRGVPYGVAIAGSIAFLTSRFPGSLWVF